MIKLYLGSALFLGVAAWAVSGSAGCATLDDTLGTDEQAATPPEPRDSFALAESCGRLFKRHESVRPVDLEQGVIRWACGDVPGVTDTDLGQEYCEYQAVQGGRIKRKASDIDPSQPVSCVFTSIFLDASGQSSRLRQAMAAPENLGAAAGDDGIVQMRKSFNTRSAATGLLRDCSTSSPVPSSKLRMAACYQAYAAGGPNAERLKQLCSAASTISDGNWTEAERLGAKVRAPGDDGYENQRDIASCLGVRGNGVAWRNSDPMICSRTQRTTSECGCRFGSVPSSVVGFAFTGWVDDQIPSSCRLAKVEGQAFPYIAICDLTQEEISDLPLNPQYARNVGNFCHDRFGVDLVMKLPLRALATSCSSSPGFCSEYMSTASGHSLADEPIARELGEEGEDPAFRGSHR